MSRLVATSALAALARPIAAGAIVACCSVGCRPVRNVRLPEPTPAGQAPTALPARAPGSAEKHEAEPAVMPPATPIAVEPPALGAPAVELPSQTYAENTPVQGVAAKAIGSQIAELQPWQCRAALRTRKIPVAHPGQPARGVASPLRLMGPVRGIHVVSPGRKSVYGILDCRLAVLLYEVAPLLESLGVSHIFVDNFFRPRAHLPGKRVPSQHAFGLAVDIHSFRLTDGTVLVVERDFHGLIGAEVCGPEAVLSELSRESVLLRNIVCALGRSRAFNYLLTPNHDKAHSNHLHADIKRGSRDYVVR